MTPIAMASAIRCGRRAVRGCGFGCQRRHLATKWLCPTSWSAKRMLIVQATRNLSSVTLLVGAGMQGRRDSGRGGGGLGIRMVRGEGNRGGKKMLDVRRGWWVGLWGGREGGNGLVSEKRRGAGPVCSAFEGVAGYWSLWTRGMGRRNGRLCCAVGALRGGVGCCLPWAFTGMFGAGCGFGAGLVETFGREGCWLEPYFWFRFWFRIGLHGRW